MNSASVGKKKILCLVWDSVTAQFQSESRITSAGRGLFKHLRDPYPYKPEARFVDVSSSWPAYSMHSQNISLDLSFIKTRVRVGIFILLLVEVLGFEDFGFDLVQGSMQNVPPSSLTPAARLVITAMRKNQRFAITNHPEYATAAVSVYDYCKDYTIWIYCTSFTRLELYE
jgi:hypothetical protein